VKPTYLIPRKAERATEKGSAPGAVYSSRRAHCLFTQPGILEETNEITQVQMVDESYKKHIKEVHPHEKYRLIWILADGRKKYSTNLRNEIQKWTARTIRILEEDFEPNRYCFRDSLSIFHPNNSQEDLDKGYAIAVEGFEIELFNTPLTDGVIVTSFEDEQLKE